VFLCFVCSVLYRVVQTKEALGSLYLLYENKVEFRFFVALGSSHERPCDLRCAPLVVAAVAALRAKPGARTLRRC
jgi:hypothetical protein